MAGARLSEALEHGLGKLAKSANRCIIGISLDEVSGSAHIIGAATTTKGIRYGPNAD